MKPHKNPEPATRARALGADAATLMVQALLSRATALARSGCYDSAERVLDGVPRDYSEGLDLLARIRAQQGRIPDAIAFWTEALRLDPGNAVYEDSLRKAGQMKAAPWRRWSRPLLAVGLLVALIMGMGLGINRLSSPKPQVATAPPAQEQPRREAFDIPTFQIPGLIQSRSGAATVLRFEWGLFDQGTRLTAEAKNALAALARQIEPRWQRMTLTVIGHTDDLPLIHRSRFQDNEALAIMRADTVIRNISKVTAIPRSAWTIGRKSGDDFLYPVDSMNGRSKNRTVEIQISPK